MSDKMILDVTCGGRSIWFDKKHKNAIYCDRREETHKKVFGKDASERTIEVKPDVVCDFTNLPFDDESFNLVVFDPPHIVSENGADCWLKLAYGYLEPDWKDTLREGFKECMRVLKPGGVLVFKWAETSFSTREVINAIGQEPLFGHRSGKKATTHWMTFMKLPEPGEEGKS